MYGNLGDAFSREFFTALSAMPGRVSASGLNTIRNADYNAGAQNSLYSGGDRQSWLLVPIIPPK